MRRLLLFLIFVCVGCGSNQVEPSTYLKNAELPFGKWKLQSFGDDEAFPYDVSIEIKNETNDIGQYQIIGKAAVNFYYASFEMDSENKTLLLYGVSSTKALGDAQAINFETKYYDTLVAIECYELSNNNETLRLYLTGNSKQQLVFKRM